MRVTFLGTGTSAGVPMIGCECAVCHSADPRDRRLRPSILIDLDSPSRRPASSAADESPTASAVRYILVDTATDLRTQALACGVTRVDAILFTHTHADHVMGLDDVRRFNAMQSGAIGCYADPDALADLRRMFPYVFDGKPRVGGGVPKLTLFSVAGSFSLGGIEVVSVPLMHGPRRILGYRLGSFAYLTDCNAIPDESWPLLEGVRTLVLDALRDRPHPTHFTVDESLEVVGRLRPDRTYFTHMCHDLAHAATNARLPRGVELAYDGLVVEM